ARSPEPAEHLVAHRRDLRRLSRRPRRGRTREPEGGPFDDDEGESGSMNSSDDVVTTEITEITEFGFSSVFSVVSVVSFTALFALLSRNREELWTLIRTGGRRVRPAATSSRPRRRPRSASRWPR